MTWQKKGKHHSLCMLCFFFFAEKKCENVSSLYYEFLGPHLHPHSSLFVPQNDMLKHPHSITANVLINYSCLTVTKLKNSTFADSFWEFTRTLRDVIKEIGFDAVSGSPTHLDAPTFSHSCGALRGRNCWPDKELKERGEAKCETTPSAGFLSHICACSPSNGETPFWWC